jgi:hypothetical protein
VGVAQDPGVVRDQLGGREVQVAGRVGEARAVRGLQVGAEPRGRVGRQDGLDRGRT